MQPSFPTGIAVWGRAIVFLTVALWKDGLFQACYMVVQELLVIWWICVWLEVDRLWCIWCRLTLLPSFSLPLSLHTMHVLDRDINTLSLFASLDLWFLKNFFYDFAFLSGESRKTSFILYAFHHHCLMFPLTYLFLSYTGAFFYISAKIWPKTIRFSYSL